MRVNNFNSSRSYARETSVEQLIIILDAAFHREIKSRRWPDFTNVSAYPRTANRSVEIVNIDETLRYLANSIGIRHVMVGAICFNTPREFLADVKCECETRVLYRIPRVKVQSNLCRSSARPRFIRIYPMHDKCTKVVGVAMCDVLVLNFYLFH